MPLTHSAGDLAFDLAPRVLWGLEADPAKAFHLTKRAADKWDAPRFLGMFLPGGWFRFDSHSTLRPLAANAGRWVPCSNSRWIKHIDEIAEFS